MSRAKFTIFGTFPQIEDQMCEWVPGVEKSPDRIDARVLAITKFTEGFLWHEPFDLTK